MNSVIYKPKGKAAEYGDWATNIYSGCEHNCSYCYVPGVLHKSPQEFHEVARVRKDYFERLERDIKRWQDRDTKPQVFLCFTCDPYQPIERVEQATRKTIKMLHDGGFTVNILTKNPMLAVRDLDLLTKKDKVGTTLTYSSENWERSLEEEPNAPLPHEREIGIAELWYHGIPTWVSLEPILSVQDAAKIIEETRPYVKTYKLGKLNYRKSDINWARATNELVSLLERLEKPYMVKEDLQKYI